MKHVDRPWRNWDSSQQQSPSQSQSGEGSGVDNGQPDLQSFERMRAPFSDSNDHLSERFNTKSQKNSGGKLNNIKRYKDLHKVKNQTNMKCLLRPDGDYSRRKLLRHTNNSNFVAQARMSDKDRLENTMKNYNVNLEQAESLGINIKDYSNHKKLARSFAIAVDKLAEHYTGDDAIGEEFWDMNELSRRCITKRSINKCKKSREKETITLLLDSSPSCSQLASFFSSIASVAVKYDFLEMYDAPNMRIVYKYSKSTQKFEPAWDEDEINDELYDWHHWRNKNIIVFTDYDGVQILQDNCRYNKISYFSNTDLLGIGLNRIESLHSEIENYDQEKIILNNCNLFPNIKDIDSFIKAVKTIK